MIPWDPLPGLVAGKRTQRRWLLLALLGVAVLAVAAVTVVTVQVRHFLLGSVPLTDVSPGFGTGAVSGTPVVSPDGRMLYVPSGTKSTTPVVTATGKAMAVNEPGSGSSADGKGEEGIDRSFERAGAPLRLGE